MADLLYPLYIQYTTSDQTIKKLIIDISESYNRGVRGVAVKVQKLLYSVVRSLLKTDQFISDMSPELVL